MTTPETKTETTEARKPITRAEVLSMIGSFINALRLLLDITHH